MTAAVAEPTLDATALLSEVHQERAAIEKALAAMLDPLDIPGSWTERQRLAEAERRVRLPQHVTALNTLAGQVTKAFATRDALRPQADRLIAAGTTIEQLIADAPDVNGIADRREQTHQWARQNMLRASLTAIERGVEYFNGHPALPDPLRELLTDTCATCGHAEVLWPGPLGLLEEKIEKAEQVIASAAGTLASIRESAKQWLHEVTT